MSTTTATLAPATLTETSTQTTTSTVTQTTSTVADWAYGAMVILLLIGLAISYVIKRPTVKQK
jgi:predicted S18 family serine protease